jgi:serine/threonine-protein kinase
LKVLNASHSGNDRFLKRFQREAQTAARLDHPNIVTIYEVGEQAGIFYIAMAYLAGPTLKEILHTAAREKHPLTLAYTSNIISQIAAALTYAYQEHKIVHRDIKPANVIVSQSGHVTLTDFGIARALEEDSDLTSDGSYLGTPLYMSPEHVNGTKIDHYSDIYSLGIVLYQMLVGQEPFDGTTTTIMYKHAHELPKPPSKLNKHLPGRLDGIVSKALAKKPGERYQTAQALAEALEKITHHKPTKPVVLRWGLPMLMVILLLVVSGWLVRSRMIPESLFAQVGGIAPTAISTDTPAFTATHSEGKAVLLSTLTPTPSAQRSQPDDSTALKTPGQVQLLSGPGMLYHKVGQLAPNTLIDLQGRNSQNSWVYVESKNGATGWLHINALGLTQKTIASLPLIQPPPTPTTPPTSTPWPTRTFTPKPTQTPRPTNTPTSAPVVVRPCPITLRSPADESIFTTADAITLRWSSPGSLAYNQSYRLSFRRTDNLELQALIIRRTSTTKPAGDTHWSDANGQWLAHVSENNAYKWVVEVVQPGKTEPLCSSEARLFFWHLK